MSEVTLDDKMRAARKACHCLFAQVPEEVARSVTDAVDAAITGYDALCQQLAHVTGKYERLLAFVNNSTYGKELAQMTQERDAFQMARHAVWEQAAIYWDTMAEGPCKDGEDFAWACRVAQWCREQARKKTQP